MSLFIFMSVKEILWYHFLYVTYSALFIINEDTFIYPFSDQKKEVTVSEDLKKPNQAQPNDDLIQVSEIMAYFMLWSQG